MTPRSPTQRQFLTVCAIAAFLVGGTLLLYSRALGYGFSNYDDPRYILNNAYVQQGFTWASVKWAFVGNADYWHPLTWFSHMLDRRLYGDNAAGHHLTSVLWHALNAGLAFLVFRRLTRTTWTSALAAAVFAWHPLRVESVVWITERKDVMSGTFFLLTLWAYVEYASRAARRPMWYVLTLACFAIGLMCKPILVTVPLALLAIDFWPLRRFDPARPAVRSVLLEKVPFFALSAATAIATIVMQRAVGAFTLPLPFGARIANAPVSIVRYLGKFFWPDALAVCYPHPGWWPNWTVAASTLLVVAISVLAWRLRRTAPMVLTGWCWFLAMLLPAIGIVQVGFQAMADRYTYVSMLGAELAIFWLFSWPGRGRGHRMAVAAAASVSLVPLAIRTWQQEATWRDPETLFTHAIAVTNRNAMAEAFLGYTLAAQDRIQDAATHCERAIALDPQNEMAVYTLAGIRTLQGQAEDAIAGYRTSLRLKPDDPTTEYALGMLLLKQGHADEASTLLRKAAGRQPSIVADNLRLARRSAITGQIDRAALEFAAATVLEPSDAEAHFELGRVLVQLGRDRDAIACLQRTLELKPGFAQAQVELGFVLLRSGRPIDAIPLFKSARSSHPALLDATVGLGRAAEQLGRTQEADEAFRDALAKAPDDPDVARAWAEVLARRGRFNDAVTFYRRAVALRPIDAASHAGLGFVLLLTGRRDEALREWKEALRLNPRFPGLKERIAELEGR